MFNAIWSSVLAHISLDVLIAGLIHCDRVVALQILLLKYSPKACSVYGHGSVLCGSTVDVSLH